MLRPETGYHVDTVRGPFAPGRRPSNGSFEYEHMLVLIPPRSLCFAAIVLYVTSDF